MGCFVVFTLIMYHFVSEMVRFDLFLYHNNRCCLLLPAKTDEASLIGLTNLCTIIPRPKDEVTMDVANYMGFSENITLP